MEIDSKSWLAFLTPIWLCGPYSLITLRLTKAQRARAHPGWITDTQQPSKFRPHLQPGGDGRKEETFRRRKNRIWLRLTGEKKGDKEQEWDLNQSLLGFFSPPLFAGCAADLHCGELCLCVCSLCVSIRPSICLSPPSITCVICGSLLCTLKAQLGSRNPLDWCSVVSMFHRNDHLVWGPAEVGLRFCFSLFWGGETVWVFHSHLSGFSLFFL